MTNYEATPAQWRQIENSQVFNGSFQACVLELRSRVEKLELATSIHDAVSKEVKNMYFPSIKEQALVALHAIATGADDTRELHQDLDTIRRALEELDD